MPGSDLCSATPYLVLTYAPLYSTDQPPHTRWPVLTYAAAPPATLSYAPTTRCPVLSYAPAAVLSYAVSGTELAYGASSAFAALSSSRAHSAAALKLVLYRKIKCKKPRFWYKMS
eukprot:1739334-Rhodomonas_salina.3